MSTRKNFVENRHGRPLNELSQAAIASLRQQGLSLRAIARRLNFSLHTVQRYATNGPHTPSRQDEK